MQRYHKSTVKHRRPHLQSSAEGEREGPGRRAALRSGVRGAAAQDAGAHGLLDVLRQHLPNLRTHTELTTWNSAGSAPFREGF